MVQVLIINFYEDSSNGNLSFIKFKTIIERTVTERCDGRIAGQCNFICKRQDELADFILDWEHDYLDEKAKVSFFIIIIYTISLYLLLYSKNAVYLID